MLDGSDFPKQGRKSAGVARQYCGRLGTVANCLAGMFLAYVSPLGRELVGKRLYLPQVWASDDARCRATGMPEDTRGYRPKAELALGMLARARERDHFRAKRVGGDDALGMSPPFREGLGALGMWYVLDVPGGTTVWPLEPTWTSPEYQGSGRPRKTQAAGWAAPDRGAAERLIAGGCLEGDNGGGGIPGFAELYVQRLMGAVYQEAQARGGAMGCLPPEP